MIRNLLASLIVGLLAFAATSCSVDDLDTTGLQLSCEKGGCPSGWTCQDARCVPPDGELPGEGGDEGEGEGLAEGGQGREGGQAEGEEGEGEGEGGVDPVVAASLRLVDVPAELAAGGAFTVTVEVVSEAGEIAEGFGGLVQIAGERDGVPIELTGVIELQAGSGVVVFDKLSLTLAGAGTVLVARSGELAEGRSNKFDVLPGPPAELRFLQEPTNARINQPILPLVQVGLVDEFGNASIGAEPVAVNLALAVDPTGVAALGGSTEKTNEGVATFPALQLDRAGAGYHLSADALGFSQRLSARFSVGGPGAPDLVITMGASGGFDIYEDIVADGSDGFIAIGSFAGEHRIGEDTITSLGGTDGIVVRFDAAGELLWATRFGGVEDDEGLRLSITGEGMGRLVRIVGYVKGEARFERRGRGDIILGRRGDGQRMFMATLGAAVGDVSTAFAVTDEPIVLNDMACTLAGDCYLTGSFDREVTFQGTRGIAVDLAPVNGGRDDAFFARVSPTGVLRWAQAGGGRGDNDAGIAVTVANPEFPTFVGTVDVQNQSRAIFGNDQKKLGISFTQGIDVFVLRMTEDGAAHALLRFGGVGTDRPTAVLTTDSGLVVGGTTESGISFDHLPGTGARGGEDGFVVSTNFELQARWIRGIGGEDFDGVRALGLAPSREELTVGIIVAGVFRGTLPVSESRGERVPNLVSPEFSGLNGYLLRLAAADGGLDWATSFDGLEATDPIALATSRTVASVSIHANSAVVLGRNQAPDPGRGRAGEQTIAGGGPPDAVVAHFDLIDGAYLSGGGYGGGGAQDVFLGVSALPDGGFLASGGFSGRAFIGQDERGDDVHMLTSGSVDGVIANYGPEGEVRWTAQAAGPDHSLFLQAFAAPDGQIAAAGIYVGAATFGSGEVGGDGLLGETFLGASERFSIFTSGLDSGGKLRWLKTASGDGILFPSTLGWSTDRSAMSLSGLALGDGELRFGPGADEAMVVTPGQSAGFMATYAVEDGSLRRLVALPGEDGSVSIAASVEMADGGVVICGGWSGVLNIGGLTFASAGQADSYVARFSPQGDLAWLTLIYSKGGDDLSGLRVAEIDGELSVVIIGETDDDDEFMFIKRAEDADHIAKLEAREAVFIARLDAGNGKLIWVELIHAVDGSVDLEGLDIAGSRVAIAGYFYGPIEVGRGQDPGIGREGETALTTGGDRDMLVALYEGGDGALRWVRRVGGKEDQAGRGVALLPNGGVVAVGQFGGVAVVDGAGGIEPQEVDARDGHDGIVVRWLP